MQRISVCVFIDAVLNFDSDVDENADVKCEQSISLKACQEYQRY